MKQLFLGFFLSLSSLLFAQKELIDAAVAWDDINWYFVKENTVVKFDKLNNKVLKTNTIAEAFPGIGFNKIDAILDYGNGKIYFFSGNQYTRFDRNSNKADAGFPKNTSEVWNTLTYSRFDAAISYTNGKSYFFKGNEYVRYDRNRETTDEGYPKTINASTWPGVFTSIDAALTSAGNSKAYFFSGSQVIRYDIATDQSDEGYPKDISIFKGLKEALANNNPAPNPEPDPIVNNENYGQFSLSSFKVPVSNSAESPNKVVADYMLRKGIKEQVVVAYQEKHDIIFLKIDKNGAKIGRPIIIKSHWISDYMVMPDGSIAVIAGKSVNNTYLDDYPNTLYFINISAAGVVGSAKHIFGGEGHGAGKSWFDGRSGGKMTFNGVNFGLYFEVQKNWAEPGKEDDIHNGDMFIQTDKDGNKIESTKHFWTASHSNTVQVTAAANKAFWTMTIGDAHPYGLQVYNRDKNQSFIAWPPQEQWISYEDCQSSSAAGLLYFADEVDGNFIAIMGTLDNPNIGWGTKVDPLFLKFDAAGNTLEKKFLKVSLNTNEGNISVHPLGENYLVAFGEGNEPENLQPQNFEICIIDKNGNFLYQPTRVEAAFGSDSELIPISAKEFVWFYIDNESEELQMFKLTFE